MKVNFVVAISLIIGLSFGCSSTQKTGGAGLVSVVTQNVVRIAGVQAMKDANLSALNGKMTYVKLTGFIDEQNKNFIDHLVRSKAEDAGARLVSEDKASFVLEAVVHNAGNDYGSSKVPLLTRSERTEASVDMDLVIRNISEGTKISTQHIRGESKYEQTTVIGIQGSGSYYVKNKSADYVSVEDPMSFK